MTILLQLQSHLNIPSIGKADRVVTPSVEKPVYFELFTTTPFMANKDAGALCRAGRKGGMPSVSVNSQFRKQRRWTSTWASKFMIVLYITIQNITPVFFKEIARAHETKHITLHTALKPLLAFLNYRKHLAFLSDRFLACHLQYTKTIF